MFLISPDEGRDISPFSLLFPPLPAFFPLYLHSSRPGKKAACLDVGRRGPQSGSGTRPYEEKEEEEEEASPERRSREERIPPTARG